jgi:hypothetical protein
LLEGGQKKHEPEPTASLRKKMVRAIDRVAEAMSDANFVAGRSPSRLAADLGSTALLMRKALSDGHVTVDEYKRWTGRLWQALFFGPDGQGGTVPEHMESLNGEEAFIIDFASPRLSAAMALWCMTEWGSSNADGAWFRLSAAQLAVRLPWLGAGGSPEEVMEELSRMATVLLPKEAQQDLAAAWRRWMRSATALTQLENALKGLDPKVLASMCSRPRIADGELLWQAGKLHVAVGDCVRTGKATVRALGRQETSKFTGMMLAPVSDLLNSDLGLSSAAVAELRELFVSATASHVGG